VGGFEKALEFEWNAGKRFLYFISSTNPHGAMYSNILLEDQYPEGDPLNRNVE